MPNESPLQSSPWNTPSVTQLSNIREEARTILIDAPANAHTVATRMQRPIHTLAVSVRESCMDAGQSDKASILDWWNSHFDSGVRSGDGWEGEVQRDRPLRKDLWASLAGTQWSIDAGSQLEAWGREARKAYWAGINVDATKLHPSPSLNSPPSWLCDFQCGFQWARQSHLSRSSRRGSWRWSYTGRADLCVGKFAALWARGRAMPGYKSERLL